MFRIYLQEEVKHVHEVYTICFVCTKIEVKDRRRKKDRNNAQNRKVSLRERETIWHEKKKGRKKQMSHKKIFFLLLGTYSNTQRETHCERLKLKIGQTFFDLDAVRSYLIRFDSDVYGIHTKGNGFSTVFLFVCWTNERHSNKIIVCMSLLFIDL